LENCESIFVKTLWDVTLVSIFPCGHFLVRQVQEVENGFLNHRFPFRGIVGSGFFDFSGVGEVHFPEFHAIVFRLNLKAVEVVLKGPPKGRSGSISSFLNKKKHLDVNK
jgi:hypothetical protein